MVMRGASTAEEIAGPDGLLAHLTRRLLNRALEAELTAHLGYPPGQAPPGGAGNARNGQPLKTVLTDRGPLRIRSPRDRQGTFEPEIVHKRQTRWVGCDEKVISLYARGLAIGVNLEGERDVLGLPGDRGAKFQRTRKQTGARCRREVCDDRAER